MNSVHRSVLGKTRISLKFFFIAAVWESGVAQTASLGAASVRDSDNTVFRDEQIRDFFYLAKCFITKWLVHSHSLKI